jgi:uncharacterized membrane protein|tara:strand:+ start:1960 stop:2349 length:390 start_codon:yes stop_codon:yes gene_type:complete
MNWKESVTYALIYLCLDAIWLYTMTPIFYRKRFELIQTSEMKIRIPYAVLAYGLLLFTLFYICIPLSKEYKQKQSWIPFAFVGLSIYGVYNLTNAAVFSKYPMDLCVVDTIWGGVCFGLMGYIYYMIKK